MLTLFQVLTKVLQSTIRIFRLLSGCQVSESLWSIYQSDFPLSGWLHQDRLHCSSTFWLSVAHFVLVRSDPFKPVCPGFSWSDSPLDWSCRYLWVSPLVSRLGWITIIRSDADVFSFITIHSLGFGACNCWSGWCYTPTLLAFSFPIKANQSLSIMWLFQPYKPPSLNQQSGIPCC